MSTLESIPDTISQNTPWPTGMDNTDYNAHHIHSHVHSRQTSDHVYHCSTLWTITITLHKDSSPHTHCEVNAQCTLHDLTKPCLYVFAILVLMLFVSWFTYLCILPLSSCFYITWPSACLWPWYCSRFGFVCPFSKKFLNCIYICLQTLPDRNTFCLSNICIYNVLYSIHNTNCICAIC